MMHKDFTNGSIDLLPDLKRYRCTMTLQLRVTPPQIFTYATNKFQAALKALKYFKKEFGIPTSVDQISNVEVIEELGESNEAIY